MARSILAASLLIALAGAQQPALAENDVDRYPQDVGATLSSASAESRQQARDADAFPTETADVGEAVGPAEQATAFVPLPPVRPALLGGKASARAGKPASLASVSPSAPQSPGLPVQDEAQHAPAVAVEMASASAFAAVPAAATAAPLPAAWQSVPALSQEAIAETTTAARIAVASRAGPAAIHALIATHAAQQGVPVSLADAVVRIESRYNPAARNGPYMGLTQIAHRTAQSLGYVGDAAGLLDPAVNLRYGMRYLAQAYKLAGGDTCRTVMKYQSGHRAMSMTAANRKYCAKVRTIVGSVN